MNKSQYFSLLPIQPFFRDGAEEFIEEMSREQLQEVLDVKAKFYNLSKK